MFLIWTHTQLCIMHRRERYIYLLEGGTPIWGLVLYFFIHIIQRKFCWVFLLLQVFQDKSLCSFVRLHLSIFQWYFAYGYAVMMLNVIRSDITIKNLTWYQSYPERSLCTTETMLQLQLLKIVFHAWKP